MYYPARLRVNIARYSMMKEAIIDFQFSQSNIVKVVSTLGELVRFVIISCLHQKTSAIAVLFIKEIIYQLQSFSSEAFHIPFRNIGH